MMVIRAFIHKMLVRIANREDPDQTASSEVADLAPELDLEQMTIMYMSIGAIYLTRILLIAKELLNKIKTVPQFTHIHQFSKVFECKNVNIFLSISFEICFHCSKEPLDETVLLSTNNMFCLRNKKIIF